MPEWEPELLQEEEPRTEGRAVEGSRRSGPAARTGHDKELQDLRELQEPELPERVEVEPREEEPGGEDTGRTEQAGTGRGRVVGGRHTALLEEELEDHQWSSLEGRERRLHQTVVVLLLLGCSLGDQTWDLQQEDPDLHDLPDLQFAGLQSDLQFGPQPEQ